jgi:hypothetical protein
MGETCQLDVDCPAIATARISRAHRPTGAIAYMTVVPATYGHGGTLGCADHVHAQVDGMLLTSLGPADPPARERLDGPQS